MRALTFATVVIGCQTVIAGILGMNFEAPFFKSAALGFWAAVAAMGLVGVVAFFVWKRTDWR
jgi:Mg2+ and Co2+ transporter CorA